MKIYEDVKIELVWWVNNDIVTTSQTDEDKENIGGTPELWG